ncbi:MAG TPA: DPP IV N-terminal domain-containing protein [Parafilimonas sp.]|nr:DPP IV N-terminal domain-containing protein [Parafilimonas sp.]
MKKIILPAAFFLIACNAFTQRADSLTANDYKHAESFLSYATEQFVDNGKVVPNWLASDKFWYRNLTAHGSEFILVDPATGKRAAAFDQQKLANALSAATGERYQPFMLPIESLQFSDDGHSIIFAAAGKLWRCDLTNYVCHAVSPTANSFAEGNPNEVLSPDGSKAAFLADNNLWIRDVATNKLTQLTTDGEKDFGYATDNAGWKSSDMPVLRWSPNSKKIATFKQDQRDVGDMYLVLANVGHPILRSWKYPLPGDKNIITIQRVIIDVDTRKVIMLNVPPDPHRSSFQDDISASGTFDDVDWSADGSELAFLSTSRDHKQEKFRIADANTGNVREIFEEVVPTQYESGPEAVNWRYLAASKEIIWYSERDNWGHLYLYDAVTGKLKNQITKGDWVVTNLIKVDEKKRELYFRADGREPGNPYFSHFYKIDFAGKHLTPLTPEEGTHEIVLSPSQNYFVDTYSQPDVPAVTVLRSLDGTLISKLETTDISRLTATGWKPPIPFTVKAHDGKTDVYGLLYVPTSLNSKNKYPVIDYIYPGPSGGSIDTWSFTTATRDNQALAELGFVVFMLEGTSNPFRSKSYHDMNYGNMAENTLPDQVACIRQLAQRYAYIDTTRIGTWGHSGGGFAAACAMFRYPDFFKVGISESGNHDNRVYEDDWGERYIGLLVDSNGTSNYESQANQIYAKNLKGKLLLAHGMADNNVPPYNTMLVIDALERANKDYDLVIFPYATHGYGGENYIYMMRRRWDYFVKNLLGKEPPKEYLFEMNSDPRNVLQ